MSPADVIILILEKISSEYGKHMLSSFAANAVRGIQLPFVADLSQALAAIDGAIPGYAEEMLDRLGAVRGNGERQYESILQILAEIFVTRGVVDAADRSSGSVMIAHEPGPRGQKNPECEAVIRGTWCAVEVKTPQLVKYGRERAAQPMQMTARHPTELADGRPATKPRDNPVKDFLVSAEAKFAAYETYRSGAYRLLVIVWDDYCNEPISALLNPGSGLLTENSFYRDAAGKAAIFPHIDGVIVVRHQHQLVRATAERPLVDGVTDAMQFQHSGYPPKAFIQMTSGRVVPPQVLAALNTVPLDQCNGAEYLPMDLVFWSDV